jgi:hypothetical protein
LNAFSSCKATDANLALGPADTVKVLLLVAAALLTLALADPFALAFLVVTMKYSPSS